LNGELIKNILKGVAVSVFVSAMFLFLFAFVCTKQADPKALTGVFGKTALVLGSIAGGFVSARLYKHSGVICGICCGLVFSVILITLSLLLGNLESDSSNIKWLLLLIVPVVSAVGGFLGVPSGKVKRRRR